MGLCLGEGNPKKVWRCLNMALGRSLNNPHPVRSSDLSLATEFNQYFLNKVKSICQQVAAKEDNDFLNLVLPPSTTQISVFSSLTNKEVFDIIRSSPRKSCSLDELPTAILCDYIDVLIDPITAIVNGGLSEGMPQRFKHALIIPLLKKPNLPSDKLESYRPVSNLVFLSKIIERAVLVQLMHHFESNKLLDPCQSAYRRNHSCATALTSICDSALRALDDGNMMLLVLLDMSSAFDTVHHGRLVCKLVSLGVAGEVLLWIKNYLTGRSQSVSINGTNSPSVEMSTGVPQGSILGPVLFIAYLTGLGDVIRGMGISYKVYADDVQLYLTFPPHELGDAAARMEACIVKVESWLSCNSLVLNCNKTENMLIATQSLIKRHPFHGINVNGQNIGPKFWVRDLGVEIDCNMTMVKHVTKICQIAYCNMHLISRISKSMDIKMRKAAIHSLVLSHIDYASILLYGLPAKVTKKLDQIIKSSLRIVLSLRFRDPVTHVYKDHNWLTFSQRVSIQVALMVYRAVYWSTPAYLSELLTPAPVNPRNLRSYNRNFLLVPRTRTRNGDRAFSVCAAKLWNGLPTEIRAIEKICEFKSSVIKFVCEL
jgi:hypothetical protein